MRLLRLDVTTEFLLGYYYIEVLLGLSSATVAFLIPKLCPLFMLLVSFVLADGLAEMSVRADEFSLMCFIHPITYHGLVNLFNLCSRLESYLPTMFTRVACAKLS